MTQDLRPDRQAMNINIITLFPEVFTAYLDASIPGRAAAARKVAAAT